MNDSVEQQSTTDLNKISILVYSSQQDDADAISRLLRNNGHAAHCNWVSDINDIPTIIEHIDPELLVVFASHASIDLAEAIKKARDQLADLPIVSVQNKLDEASIAKDLALGASDAVTMALEERTCHVLIHQIKHFQHARSAQQAETKLHEMKQQLDQLVEESAAPMVYVNEGIIIYTNSAWLELFGYLAAEDIIGTPIMNIFDQDSRSPIKGAIMACTQNKWTGHQLPSKVISNDGSTLVIAAEIEATRYEDEPCVRIIMESATTQTDSTSSETNTSGAGGPNRHPLTGFSQRRAFYDALQNKLNEKLLGGMRALAYIKVDHVADLRDSLGPMRSDDILLEFAELLKSSMKANDVYGQFGGDVFMALIARGTERDASAWAEKIRSQISKHVFEVNDKSISITVAVGITIMHSSESDLDIYMSESREGYVKAIESGGNRIVFFKRDDTDIQEQLDKIPVQTIKHALMKDAFNLVHQPIASLDEQGKLMFDILIRMTDEQGEEVMPGDFLPVASKHGLMQNIDRWVIVNTLKFAKEHKPDRVFVRLSVESITDSTLPKWIKNQINEQQVEPSRLVFQITEKNASDKLKQTKALVKILKKMGCLFAIEHFGVGERPLNLLEHLSTDFIKIDGSLMETVVGNPATQNTVREFVKAAKAKNIETIAERIEDADTMACLWQLNVQYMQGFYVQGPEEVVIESATM